MREGVAVETSRSGGEVAPSGGRRGSAARIAIEARSAASASRAASAVSWRISSTVSEALIATEASASARSCSMCSCSMRAISCTSW